ncbi:MAG: hypothetical protein GXP52_08495 [Deltaproteobacteria bacterium]|nr:hypothetical protein [Deltaproteobacteria bacterium]
MMRTKTPLLVIVLFLFLAPGVVFAGKTISVNFDNEVVGAPSKSFSSFVGTWYIDKDGNKMVYAVDGRKWARGTMSAGIADKAKALYGQRYAEFLDSLAAYKYFPLTIYQGIKSFSSGTISVKFKAISGRIDRAAGIAFNIKPNGDYLVIRANPAENNIVAFKMERGYRSVVQWIRNVPIRSRKWYTLKVVVKDDRAEGYLNNKRYISFKFKKKIDGKIGLWSKSDSYVFFDNFTAQSN